MAIQRLDNPPGDKVCRGKSVQGNILNIPFPRRCTRAQSPGSFGDPRGQRMAENPPRTVAGTPSPFISTASWGQLLVARGLDHQRGEDIWQSKPLPARLGAPTRATHPVECPPKRGTHGAAVCPRLRPWGPSQGNWGLQKLHPPPGAQLCSPWGPSPVAPIPSTKLELLQAPGAL